MPDNGKVDLSNNVTYKFLSVEGQSITYQKSIIYQMELFEHFAGQLYFWILTINSLKMSLLTGNFFSNSESYVRTTYHKSEKLRFDDPNPNHLHTWTQTPAFRRRWSAFLELSFLEKTLKIPHCIRSSFHSSAVSMKVFHVKIINLLWIHIVGWLKRQ